MRVSSIVLSTAALGGIQKEQTAIARLTQQLAADRRVLAPKDDPVQAQRLLELTDRIALRKQYLANQDKASLSLNYEMTVLSQIRKVLEHARGILMGASPSHLQSLREQYSDLLIADYRQLKDLANSRDPSGNHIFAGHAIGTVPYSHTQVAPGPGTSGNSTYTGNAGVREVEIDVGRTVQVSDDIEPVFKVGTANDLLQALDQIAIDLRLTTLTQAQIDAAVNRLSTALDDLGRIERRIAAAQQEVLDTQATTRAILREEENALGRLVEMDQAATIVELQRRQVTLEAAQRAYARVSGLSLFNFL